MFEDGIAPRLERHLRGNVTVVVPHLPAGDADTDEMQRALVDEPYGQQGLVRIADDAASFVRACEAAMAEDAAERLTSADAFLRRMSWDGTWNRIDALINETLAAPQASVPSRTAAAG